MNPASTRSIADLLNDRDHAADRPQWRRLARQGAVTLAITGGTGRYRGADGEVEVRQMSDTTEDYVVRLDRR